MILTGIDILNYRTYHSYMKRFIIYLIILSYSSLCFAEEKDNGSPKQELLSSCNAAKTDFKIKNVLK